MTLVKRSRGIAIGENHRRTIGTRLRMLDEMLCEFEQYARGRQARSVLYQELNSLTESQKNQVLADIEKVRDLLRQMKATLDLEPHVEDISRLIWAKSSAFWQVLIETTSRRLAGYGELSPELLQYLDPRIEDLMRRLGRLTRHVGIRPTDAGSTDREHERAGPDGEETEDEAHESREA